MYTFIELLSIQVTSIQSTLNHNNKINLTLNIIGYVHHFSGVATRFNTFFG